MSDLLQRLAKMTHKQLMLLAYDQQRQLEGASHRRPEPIAVIGVGCRFPGGADGPQAFWDLLREGRDAIREVPVDRWDIDAYFDSDPDSPGHMAVRNGGFLDDVGSFDAAFFGIAPREALAMDPQQRLLLEVAWEALEHANVAADQLVGSATGVFVGLCNSDHFQRLLRRDNTAIDAYLASGNAPSVAAGRIAYCLGFRGPALTVDTSCSASLVAIHLACQSLRSGESSIALAGGANVICAPETTIALSKGHMLAPDGRCKTFDARADGFARGEGCGLLVLKRLSTALSDGDKVHAVIRGTAINQDGRSGGLTVPSGPAQESVIRAALDIAGATADEIDYVEAHGTGTSLGDPIEIQALASALCARRSRDAPLLVGSVKTNIGHLEAAAGVAGVIKVILALEHGAIPPHLHFERPSPHISWNKCNVAIASAGYAWAPGPRARVAGVSAFGFSGTNAHAILQEAPRTERKTSSAEPRSFHCLPLSARSGAALANLAARYVEFLSDRPALKLADVARAAGAGRSHMPRRLAVVADTAETAVEALRAFASGGSHPAVHAGVATPGESHEVVFMFPGLESAYSGIGRRLYDDSSVYREVIDRCDLAIGSDALGRTLKSFLGRLPNDDADGRAWRRLSLLAAQYAAVQLWKSFGVEPAAVVGDGDGEFAAACVAGVFPLDEALRLVGERSRLTAQSGASLSAWAKSVPAFPPHIPIAWTAGGADAPGPEGVADAGYWANLVSRTGGLADGVRRLREAGYHSFIEVNPNSPPDGRPQLRLESAPARHPSRPASGGDEWNWIAHGVAELYTHGARIDWVRATNGAAKCVLPTYPFERRRYWYAPAQLGLSGGDRSAPAARAQGSRDAPAPQVGVPSVEDLFYQIAWREALPPVRAAPSIAHPDRLAPLIRERFAALADQHGLFVYDHLLPELDRLSAAYVADALRHLGFDDTPGRVFDAEDEARRLGVAARHSRLFRRLLESLAQESFLRRQGNGFETIGCLPLADPETLMSAAKVKFGEVDGELAILQRCGASLAPTLTGRQDPLELLFPQGSFKEARKLYVESPSARTYNTALTEVLDAAIESLPSGATLRVLELGAGTGGTTSYVLPCLPPGRTEYVFTDVSQLFLERAATQFAAYDTLRTARLDIERDPFGQGFRPGQFDIIIAANVLHATQDLKQTVSHVRSLLASGGLLCLLEAVEPQRWADCTFGLTDGWWRFADHEIRRDQPLMSRDGWRDLLATSGFTGVTTFPDEAPKLRSRSHQGLIVARCSGGGRHWTLVGDKDGVGKALAQRLLARGDSVDVRTDTGEAIEGTEGTLVYLGALAVADRAVDDLAALDLCKRLACEQPLQWLAKAATGASRVWLVTRGAQTSAGDPSIGARWQAPLWGIGRAFALEHPGRFAGLVDLPAAGSHQEWAETLVAAFDAEDGEDQTAWRKGARLAPRLSRTTAPPPQPMRLRPDASYVITGGFGGIGLSVARWMADLGARHLALIGRCPDASADAVLALGRQGIKVIPLAGDVADEASMNAIFGRLAEEAPPVRGVIHAAGEFSAIAIDALTPADIDRTLRPKIDGTVYLERATSRLDLDFLVLFSSAASVFGAANYAHYAAANSFLDATAEAAFGRSRKVIAANWGAWEADSDKNREFREGGLGPMPTATALDALGRMIFNTAPRRVVGWFDWHVLRQLLEARHPRPLLRELGAARAVKATEPASTQTLAEQLAQTPADVRGGVVEDFVRREIAAVLGLAADDPVPAETGFFDLGMDSLTSVELRRRLERGSGLALPSSLTFSYPTLAAVSSFLTRQLGEEPEAMDDPAAPVLPLAAIEIEHLTDGELEARLLARLQEVR